MLLASAKPLSAALSTTPSHHGRLRDMPLRGEWAMLVMRSMLATIERAATARKA